MLTLEHHTHTLPPPPVVLHVINAAMALTHMDGEPHTFRYRRAFGAFPYWLFVDTGIELPNYAKLLWISPFAIIFVQCALDTRCLLLHL